jgi:DHA3 family tetracycline resistance protein-like MFS transporter
MPETGFRRRPRAERGSALTELRTTATAGVRYAWAAPVIVLLIGAELFMGASSEAFDRLKEAHFLRDVGLPAIGHLDPVVWFGSFWLAGMILNIAAIGSLIKRVERGGRETVAQLIFAFVLMELVAMLVFALTRSVWLAIAGLLGVFFARNMAGPLWDTWLNRQITDSSVRATVLSLTGQANAVGQAGGGPLLGWIGNVRGIRAALAVGALAIAPALGLFGRAIVHHGREPEFEELPAAVVD